MMAANTTRTRRNYSSTPSAVNGNLARKIDQQELERRLERSGQLDFDKQYRRRQETEAERLSRRRSKAKAAVRQPQKVSPAAVLGFTAAAVMLLSLLMCYVQLNAISRDIVRMKEEITNLEVEQVSLRSEYERAFDVTTVKAAAAAAGMTEPSESQIYYIHLPGENQVASYSGGNQSALDTVRGAFDGLMAYFR